MGSVVVVLVILLPCLVASLANTNSIFPYSESTITPSFDCILLAKGTTTFVLISEFITTSDSTWDYTRFLGFLFFALLASARWYLYLALDSISSTTHTLMREQRPNEYILNYGWIHRHS